MISLKITIDASGAQVKLKRALTPDTYTASLQRAMTDLLAAHQQNTPGKVLKSSYAARIAGTPTQTTLQISNTAPNARNILSWLRHGTRPHVIRANRRRFLHFEARDGNEVFTKRVRHPGTKPSPLMQRLDARIAAIIQSLREDISKTAGRG